MPFGPGPSLRACRRQDLHLVSGVSWIPGAGTWDTQGTNTA